MCKKKGKKLNIYFADTAGFKTKQYHGEAIRKQESKGIKMALGKWLIIGGSIILLAILIGLLGCDETEDGVTNGGGDTNNDVTGVHFSFDYADDIKSDPLFDTEAKRIAYKEKALHNMESLYADFYERFKFQPQHEIHVTLSETVNGAKNTAYTESTYLGDGTITKLAMHFPYEMFDREFVRAHELTHAFLAPFHLPTWADEGLAVYFENFYSETPQHPVFDKPLENLRLDADGVNAVQHWTEGRGIYADFDLTIWCYRFSHTIISHIETEHAGAVAKLLSEVHPQATLTTAALIQVFGNDISGFFEEIKFKL